MLRRWVLWCAFVVAHAGVAVFGLIHPGAWPFSDVVYAYEPWMQELVRDGAWQGLTSPGVYPALAPIPMVLAWLLAGWMPYLIAWILVACAFNAAGFAFLLGSGRSTDRLIAAWYWLAFIVCAGPVAVGRLDGITVPIAIVGALLLAARPLLAGALLAIGTWMKIWPAALIAAAVVAVRGRWRVVVGGLVTSAVVVILAIVTGGLPYVFSFVAGQTGRGIQLEAPVALPVVFAAAAGVGDASVEFDTGISTYQVGGAAADFLAVAMTPILALAVAAILAIGIVVRRRGVDEIELTALLGLALVLAMIVFNKVGSPQFVLWLIAPIVLGLSIHAPRFRLYALLSLAVAATTTAVYPLLYDHLLALDAIGLAAQTLRTAVLIAAFVIVIVGLCRVGAKTAVPEVQTA